MEIFTPRGRYFDARNLVEIFAARSLNFLHHLVPFIATRGEYRFFFGAEMRGMVFMMIFKFKDIVLGCTINK